MMIRKYVGRDERAMLKRIRSELGPDPVILHTSFVRPKGLLRRFHRPQVEIVAGSGFAIVKDYARRGKANDARPAAGAAAEAAGPGREELERQISEVKGMLAEQTEILRQEKLGGLPEGLTQEYLALTSGEVSQGLARRLVKRIQERVPAEAIGDRSAVRAALREAVGELVRCADGISLSPGRCVRVAFIGPTGVGKTTTVAKLMSVYAFRGKAVGVITNDTYRIAAAEQLRRVAQIVGVPIRVCRDEREISAAVAEFTDRDLVLVDTAGRSQKNEARIRELQSVLKAAQADEVHLVLSLTSQLPNLLDVVERFAPCGFQRIVLTKLDEAAKVGLVLDVLSRVKRELSFLATGQEIPRDIEIADPGRVTSLVLGEEGAA